MLFAHSKSEGIKRLDVKHNAAVTRAVKAIYAIKLQILLAQFTWHIQLKSCYGPWTF